MRIHFRKACCLLLAAGIAWTVPAALADENDPPAETTSASEETTPPPETTTPPPEETTPPPETTTPPPAETTPPPETTTPPPAEQTTPPPAEELFEIRDGVLTAYRGMNRQKEIRIPEGVRVIAPGVFQGDGKLEKVILPDSAEEIQDEAFAECSALKEVVLSSGTRLRRIGNGAFRRCGRIDRSFAEGVPEIAGDAFEGAAGTTKPPEKETPKPTKTHKPSPTATPEPEPEPEWDIPEAAPAAPGGGKRKSHGKSRIKVLHGYDQVYIPKPGEIPEESMHVLTLGGEELELSLSDAEGAERRFRLGLAGSGLREDEADILILEAEKDPAGGAALWHVNGAVLRKLNRSGIGFLRFRQGGQDFTVPTEGFLAGRAYDELKSRGTPGRKFDYTLIMDGTENPPECQVTVEGRTYELKDDPRAPIYLTGIRRETDTAPAARKEESAR